MNGCDPISVLRSEAYFTRRYESQIDDNVRKSPKMIYLSHFPDSITN